MSTTFANTWNGNTFMASRAEADKDGKPFGDYVLPSEMTTAQKAGLKSELGVDRTVIYRNEDTHNFGDITLSELTSNFEYVDVIHGLNNTATGNINRKTYRFYPARATYQLVLFSLFKSNLNNATNDLWWTYCTYIDTNTLNWKRTGSAFKNYTSKSMASGSFNGILEIIGYHRISG